MSTVMEQSSAKVLFYAQCEKKELKMRKRADKQNSKFLNLFFVLIILLSTN